MKTITAAMTRVFCAYYHGQRDTPQDGAADGRFWTNEPPVLEMTSLEDLRAEAATKSPPGTIYFVIKTLWILSKDLKGAFKQGRLVGDPRMFIHEKTGRHFVDCVPVTANEVAPRFGGRNPQPGSRVTVDGLGCSSIEVDVHYGNKRAVLGSDGRAYALDKGDVIHSEREPRDGDFRIVQ